MLPLDGKIEGSSPTKSSAMKPPVLFDWLPVVPRLEVTTPNDTSTLLDHRLWMANSARKHPWLETNQGFDPSDYENVQ